MDGEFDLQVPGSLSELLNILVVEHPCPVGRLRING